MPSKQHDATKPTVYLDQSTLSDAFRVHKPGRSKPVDPAYRSLRGWVERVAHQANLCVSQIHLIELAKWNSDAALADELCQWLDGLPVVGVYAIHRVKEAEEKAWVRRAAGLSTVDVLPFAPSFPATFVEPSAQHVAAVLARSGPLSYMLQLIRSHELHRRHANLAPNFAGALRTNRSDPRFAGLSPAQGRALVEQNVAQDLRRSANAAIRSLGETDDEFRRRGGPSDAIHQRAMDLFDQDPRVLPLFRIETLFSQGLAEAILRRTPGSSKDVAALSGASEDGAHLVGAAYCDVFTCDRATSNSLGAIRTQFGRRPQLAVGGYPGGVPAFVADLMATWP